MTPIDDNGDVLVAERAVINLAPGAPQARADDLEITLSFGDLLPDANGEIVIVAGPDRTHLSIVTEQRISDAGVVDSHVTADGFDVSGLSFYAFEGGTKLYYAADVDLTITPPQG